ncbi:expressed unknown protein [Seminavis robusta]|uniref:CRAL-TRIO domain-containing protein n=1 Tax=Seminavis robusta TaxID=568900 RepID=A0A9N8HJ66_9STRA|nr:expressed unknown protein [Seminavis robusta]|eukprot:Sro671_g184890.1 n/a (1424) ;mRNA; r:24895-29337
MEMWPFTPGNNTNENLEEAASEIHHHQDEMETPPAMAEIIEASAVVPEPNSDNDDGVVTNGISIQVGRHKLTLDFDRVGAALTSWWIFCVNLLQRAWMNIKSFFQSLRASVDLNKIKSKLNDWMEQLRELGVLANQHFWQLHAAWLQHESTLWMQEKTGLPPDTIVTTLGSLALLLLLSILFVTRRRWIKRRARDRSQSLTWGNSDSIRGAKDRGFSLDLDLSAAQAPANSRTRWLFGWDYFWKKKKNTQGEPNHPQMAFRQHSTGSREHRDRSGSFDLFGNTDPFFGGGGEDNNPAMQHGIATGQRGPAIRNRHNSRPRTIPPIAYHGPIDKKLVYNTWTPPPSWTEASRSLMPHDTRMKLQREIVLDLSNDECLMNIREPSSRAAPLTLPVAQCSIHVNTPLIGGVLQIYVKDSSKDEWMEHTFDTANSAAQFQTDMLAIQLFGPALQRMYQALELIHQGSIACDGREYVCHDDEVSDEVPQGIGVAWDDAMRSLGSSIPSLRVALERLWWHHYSMNSLRLRAHNRARKQQKKGEKNAKKNNNNNPSSNSSVGSAPATEGEEDGGDTEAANKENTSKEDTTSTPSKIQNEYIYLSKDYVRKRLLLGPVDFFRLFVPRLPETALPRNESNKKRMEQLLRWRKRTATSSLLVQAYVKARIVVNKGWVLHRSLPTHYLTRRLAYDDNIDNSQRDSTVKNEIYEATVSRDVLTFVRPNEPDAFKTTEHWWQWRPKRIRTVISKYQAFSLVGEHMFRIPPNEDFPLNPHTDPVETFGSLRDMIEANPDLEFFVSAIFPESIKAVNVFVFVRSLPNGIDRAFDTTFSRYKKGTEEERDRKLSMMIQLNTSENKSWAEIGAIKFMTYLMRSVANDLDASTPNSDMGPSDRTPFPVIPVARVGKLRHFGGSLQQDRDMPNNYVSATCHVDHTQSRFNVFASVLLSMMEQGILRRNVFDLTYVLAAERQDELPERALGTVRPVRVSTLDIALPSAFVYGASRRREHNRRSTWNASNFQSIRNFHSITNTVGNLSSSTRSGLKRFASFESSDDDLSRSPRQRGDSPQSVGSESQRHVAKAEELLHSHKTASVTSEDPVEKAVNELIDILHKVRVPVRRDQLIMYKFGRNMPMSLLEAYSSSDGRLHDKELMSMSLLLLISRGDIRRHYIAASCNLKKAAIRIVETSAWRGQTFPIDRRMCRIELQSGQFFQQGCDLLGNPVFYYRNMGLGPWRKDADASVAAVLHRLEEAVQEFSAIKEDFKCTLIVLMGKPFQKFLEQKIAEHDSDSEHEEAQEDDFLGVSMKSHAAPDGNDGSSEDVARVANPRVNPEETWQVHTNNRLIKQLIELVSAHYPERLQRALVVVKPTQVVSLRKIVGSYTLNGFVSSAETRSKVTFLSTFAELNKYVSQEELVTIAGGDTPIDPEVFGLYK